MAEEQVDGGPDEGTVTNANGDASGSQGVQQPSFDAAKLQKSLDALGDGLVTLTKRVDGLQGVKDKQGSELSSLKSRIAEYEKLKEKYGADGAMEQIEFRDQFASMGQALQQIQESLGSVSPQSPGKGVSGAVTADKVIATLEGYGLETNGPDVIALLKKGASESDLDKFVLNKLKPQKSASVSGIAQEPSRGGVKSQDVEALTQEYQKKLLALPGGDRVAFRQLRAEYAAKGVSVDQVVIT